MDVQKEEGDKVSEEEEESEGEDKVEEVGEVGDKGAGKSEADKEKRWIQLDAPEAKADEIDDKVKKYLRPEEGMYGRGQYVRVDTMLEQRYLGQLDARFPILVCGFDQQEATRTFARVRLKKHRWYPKILKTGDPLILSIGWRRFQSILTYIVEDSNERRRVIKYTPKFDFCQGVFYTPPFPLNTAFLGVQTLAEDVAHFRIAMTGDVVELAPSFRILKKLKLIGEPLNVHKNTAFIKGMFNSKVLLSLIFLDRSGQVCGGSHSDGQRNSRTDQEARQHRTRRNFPRHFRRQDPTQRHRVLPHLVPNPAPHPLQPHQFLRQVRVAHLSVDRQRLMRTTGELRRELDIEAPKKPDSEYKDVVREQKVFAPIIVPGVTAW